MSNTKTIAITTNGVLREFDYTISKSGAVLVSAIRGDVSDPAELKEALQELHLTVQPPGR